jgi:hypothetical protein
MSDADEIWRRKTDEQVLEAASSLDEYTEDGRRIILSEAARRGLNVAPLVQATAALQAQALVGSSRCVYCDTRILFGGKREGNLRFCNDECRQRGLLLSVSHQVPDHLVNERVLAVFEGNCPQCSGPGPVDVHTSHRVFSAVIITSWTNRPALTCKRCGTRAKVRDTMLSLALGWWALPWGIVMTPVQVVRNLAGVFSGADASRPSARLDALVRLQLATALVAAPPNTAMEPTART